MDRNLVHLDMWIQPPCSDTFPGELCPYRKHIRVEAKGANGMRTCGLAAVV